VVISGLFAASAFGVQPFQIGNQDTRSYVVAPSGEQCHKLEVHLNGNAPATIKCLDGQLSYLASRNISETGCGDTLDLWEDAYQGGGELCFNGGGIANMTGYSFCRWIGAPIFGWLCHRANDWVTSWASHNQYGWFASDINGGGIRMYYGGNSNGNFTSNPIPNDSLSSVCITAGGYYC
jgi:hypothetical protein